MAVAAMVAIGACERTAPRTADIALKRMDVAVHGYVDPQPVGSYPSSKERIQGWIDAGQNDSIRAHGWDLWQSITAMVDDSTPTWQTWYAGHEVFDSLAQPNDGAARRFAMRLPVERPKQIRHTLVAMRSRRGRLATGIPLDTFERVFSFNRFSRSTATYIWRNNLNRATTLLLYNIVADLRKTPTAQRQVMVSPDSTDPLSFVLKPVYYFIPSTGPSAVPYWAGYDSLHSVPDTTARPHVPPRRWRQAVAVDPSGAHQPGDSVFLAFNMEPAQWLKVVPLSQFYHVTVTARDSANLSLFADSLSGDDLGFDSDTTFTAITEAARPGAIALMLAMHVTGKEIANWTWQSFWWEPATQQDSLGSDRPASIPAPWNNYVMTTAYSMLTHDNQPNVAFNPYLESSLSGKTEDSTLWSGVTTNCMSCHRRAAVGYAYVPGQSALAGFAPLYGPAAFIAPGDSIIFTTPISKVRMPTLKTDFLWSVTLRAGLLQSIPVPTYRRMLDSAKRVPPGLGPKGSP
jgi:hypothetical protein